MPKAERRVGEKEGTPVEHVAESAEHGDQPRRQRARAAARHGGGNQRDPATRRQGW